MRILFLGKDNTVFKRFKSDFRSNYHIDYAGGVNYNSVEEIKSVIKNKKCDAIVFALFTGFDTTPVSTADLMMFRNTQYAALTLNIKKMIVLSNVSDLYPGKFLQGAGETLADKVPRIGNNAASFLLNSWATQDDMCYLFRIFNMFGEGVKAKDDLNKIILGGFSKKQVVNVECDFVHSGIYIGDVCRIISKFLDKDYEKGSYNLVSDEKISLFESAKKAISVAKSNGFEFDVVFESLEKEGEITGENSKLKNTIGAFKYTTLLSGISRVYHSAESETQESDFENNEGNENDD